MNKVLHPAMTQQYMAAYGMPFTGVFLVGAIALELLGGLSLLLGVQARWGGEYPSRFHPDYRLHLPHEFRRSNPANSVHEEFIDYRRLADGGSTWSWHYCLAFYKTLRAAI